MMTLLNEKDENHITAAIKTTSNECIWQCQHKKFVRAFKRCKVIPAAKTLKDSLP